MTLTFLTRKADSGHTILVVDDQDDTLASVRALLEREGHRVLTASSGAEALAIVERTDVQLVIVDYFMPRMTGAELVQRIRRSDPYLQIVLQTGYAGDKPPREVLAQLDIQGYHDKTDDPDRLLIWVDVALKAGRLRGLMNSTESNFLSFIKTSDVYDPDKINSDLDLIRRFYLKNGLPTSRS